MPSFTISTLQARVSICKTFRNKDKEPYPNIYNVKSLTETISSLDEFIALIKRAALNGACLLKGTLDRELEWESRKGHTDANKHTLWVCLDLDYFTSIADIEDFLRRINVTDVSYIRQWSASYGIHGNFTPRAHIFMMLDQPQSPAVLKDWLRQVNLQCFPEDQSLTRTNEQLRWALDISTCQNDKLLFVAPPICYPTDINKCTEERIVLVRKAKDVLTLPSDMLAIEQIKALEQTRINELRAAAKLPPKSLKTGFVMKEFQKVPYLSKPGEARVTNVKDDGDFVRLNLNGGDSWAYYHPKKDPTFIYNFKGEPNYRTQELLPEYWAALHTAVKQAKAVVNQGKQFFGIRDFRTAKYWNGWYDTATDDLQLEIARSERQVNDFLLNHGQPVPEAIPIWNRIYDPFGPTIDFTNTSINTFKMSPYMKGALTRQSHQPFPTIDRVCRHVMGDECLSHWYNWLAFVYQRRVAPCTAWVWHGVPGIGKGVIYKDILQPLLGATNVVQRRMEELEDEFNGLLENCLLCFVDEVQVSESPRGKVIMANLKNQITEPEITIRRMKTDAYIITNRLAWVFASNMPDAVVVSPNDRRFNVGEYQTQPIQLTEADIKAIHNELQDFAVYLRLYQVDTVQVRTVLKNQAREDLIAISNQSADALAQAILNGDLTRLWNDLPAEAPAVGDHRAQDRYHEYKKVIHDIINNNLDRLTREQLYAIFEFGVGNVPYNSWKLSSYLKHHGIEVKPIRIGNMTPRGIMVNWKESKQWFVDRQADIAQATTLPTLKVVK